MSALLTACVISSYFIILLIVGRLTARRNDNATFFTANRNSPWYLVAFGMIGTSISGVTFISVPGKVGAIAFSYFQIVLGYFFGYLIIVAVLLPLYYRLNLVSIYTYLDKRYGGATYKTGSFFFLISRTLGSSLRLMLAAKVFHEFVFKQWGLPFELTVIVSMVLIILYSIRGGIKTIIFTDTLQTVFLVASLILTILFISRHFGTLGSSLSMVSNSSFSKIFNWNFLDNNFFVKQFLSGMFITVTMTGLDQDLMQKNLTCKNLREAQKNMLVFSFILVVVNLLFLCLGVLLFYFAGKMGVCIPEDTDTLFPTLAIQYFPLLFSFVFLIGLTAATFASTDSALTALTTAVCVDFLGFNAGKHGKVSLRYGVHIALAALIVIIIWIINISTKDHPNNSIIDLLLKYSGYTYGPLLGLFAFGLFSKRKVKDGLIPVIAILSPIVTFLIELLIRKLAPNYKIGFENLLICGFLVYICLWFFSKTYRDDKHLADNEGIRIAESG